MLYLLRLENAHVNDNHLGKSYNTVACVLFAPKLHSVYVDYGDSNAYILAAVLPSTTASCTVSFNKIYKITFTTDRD